MWSQLTLVSNNVVSTEHGFQMKVSCECGLKWTGLKRIGLSSHGTEFFQSSQKKISLRIDKINPDTGYSNCFDIYHNWRT